MSDAAVHKQRYPGIGKKLDAAAERQAEDQQRADEEAHQAQARLRHGVVGGLLMRRERDPVGGGAGAPRGGRGQRGGSGAAGATGESRWPRPARRGKSRSGRSTSP